MRLLLQNQPERRRSKRRRRWAITLSRIIRPIHSGSRNWPASFSARWIGHLGRTLLSGSTCIFRFAASAAISAILRFIRTKIRRRSGVISRLCSRSFASTPPNRLWRGANRTSSISAGATPLFFPCAYAYAREVGFPQINIDHIAGMVEETEANWRECVSKTIEMSPDSVTIYEMEIPYNTTIYPQMKAAGKLAAPVADWETKRGWVQYAFQELERAGYQVGSAYTAIKHPERTKFVYRDRLWAGADLINKFRPF